MAVFVDLEFHFPSLLLGGGGVRLPVFDDPRTFTVVWSPDGDELKALLLLVARLAGAASH